MQNLEFQQIYNLNSQIAIIIDLQNPASVRRQKILLQIDYIMMLDFKNKYWYAGSFGEITCIQSVRIAGPLSVSMLMIADV